MDDNLIQTFLILHRSLGCADENASDIEQKDKILYYYPESTTIPQQLSTCHMIEGFLDFHTKFSDENDPLDTIVMENNIWSFYQCDNDSNIWIIASMKRCVDIDSQSDTKSKIFTGSILSDINKLTTPILSTQGTPYSSKTYSYPTGLKSSLERFYRIYTLFHRTIKSELEYNSEVNETIKRVKYLRKLSRKLFDQLQQTYLDIESAKTQLTQNNNKYIDNLNQDEPDKLSVDSTSLTISRDIAVRNTVDMNSMSSEEELIIDPSWEQCSEDAEIPHTDDTSLSEYIQNHNSSETFHQLSESHETVIVKDIDNKGDLDSAGKIIEHTQFEPNSDVNIENEHLGMKFGYKSIEQLQEDIVTIKQSLKDGAIELHSILDHPTAYVPWIIARNIKAYAKWYITSGELLFPSTLHCLPGAQMLSLDNASSLSLVRVRQGIEESCKRASLGCLLLYDGHVIWSDCEEHLTTYLYEFLRIQEISNLREEVIRSIETNDGSGNFKADAEWIMMLKNRKGVITDDWQAIDLEEDHITLPSFTPDTSVEDIGIIDPNRYSDKNNTGTDSISNPIYRNTDTKNNTPWNVTSSSLYSPRNIFTPRIYFPRHLISEKTLNNETNDNEDVIFGRAIFYRQNKSIAVIFIEDFNDSDGPSFLKHHAESFAKSLNSEMQCTPAEQRFLGLCASIQRVVSIELDRLDATIVQATSLTNEKGSSITRADSYSRTRMNIPNDLTRRTYSSNENILPRHTRAVYNNNLTGVTKVLGMANYVIDPMLIWPHLISVTPINKRASVTLTTSLSDISSDLRPRYSLSPSLLAASMEPFIIESMNHVYALLATNHSVYPESILHELPNHNGIYQEVCLRVRSAGRGGVWIVGKVVGSRIIISVVERCDTLNDMVDQLDAIISHAFQDVLI